MGIKIKNLRINPYTAKDTLKVIFGDEMHLTFEIPHVDGESYLCALDNERILYPINRPVCAYTSVFTRDGDDVDFTLKLTTSKLRDYVSSIRKPMPVWLQIVREVNGKYETVLLDDILAIPSVIDGNMTVYEGDSFKELLDGKMDVPEAEGTAGQVLTLDADGHYSWQDLPEIPEQEQADWDESDSSNVSFIKNKPVLATVATSGSYNDLSNKPDLTVYEKKEDLATVAESGNYADLSNKPDLSVYAEKSELATVATTGSYTDLSNKPSIPTNTSDLTNDSDFQTGTEVSTAIGTAIANKADKATTLAGYGITDAYTKTEVDSKVASVFHYKGSVNTYADLPSTDLAVGDVYNVAQADSTHGIKAGDNVAWTGSAWDVLAGDVDLTAYATKAELAPVATSGSYNDLSNKPIITQPVNADWSESDSENLAYILNKPVIPAAQVQADWDESDSSAVDYIRNKPDLSVDDTDYLCFEIASVTDTDESDSSEPSFALTSVGTTSAISLEISHDKKNWAAYTVGNGLFDTIAVGNKVWIRGDNATFSTDQSNYYQFVATGMYLKASGNIMSLLSKDCSKTDVPANAFSALFRGMTGLLTAPEFPAATVGEKAYCLTFRESGIVSAPELPAMTIARKSYSQMFQDCKALVKAPSVLPAMTLAEQCYAVMFQGCASLLNAPELPATTLANTCYNQMFQDCSALVKAPTSLPATTAMQNCYMQMFQNCTSLEKAPTISATTLARYCFTNMFQDCKSLVEAPALPATSLSGANYCYQNMFNGCSSLLAAPTLSAEALANGCYSQMFMNCVSLKTAPTLPATNVNFSQCYYGMFQGCKSLEKAPALPATTLGTTCYGNMFQDCTSLTEMPTLSATTLVLGCYNSMFKGAAIRETKELPATTLANYCYTSMFEDCPNLEVVERIHATTLAAHGMQYMLKNCPSLKYIRVAFTEWHASCTNDWVANSGSTKYKGAFVCPSSLTDTRGDSNIPTGWVKTTAASTPNMNSSSGTYLRSDETAFTVTPSANDRTYRVVVADNSALTLSAVYWWDYAYAEVVLDVPTGSSVTAGSGITLVDEPEAGKRNVCVVRWADQTAKLYVCIKEDLPQA